MSTSSQSSIVLPGQSLGSTSQFTPSTGAHLFNNQIVASLAGISSKASQSNQHPPQAKQPKATTTPSPALSVLRSAPQAPSHAQTPVLPTVGATILGRITRTTPRQATVSILCVNNVPLSPSASSSLTPTSSSSSTDTYPTGLIRSLDIRATQTDTAQISASFRPSDIVRAVVISLGDQSNYYLSTAGNELGVVMARSSEGNEMVPVSWREMRDVVSGRGEARKVARPV